MLLQLSVRADVIAIIAGTLVSGAPELLSHPSKTCSVHMLSGVNHEASGEPMSVFPLYFWGVTIHRARAQKLGPALFNFLARDLSARWTRFA